MTTITDHLRTQSTKHTCLYIAGPYSHSDEAVRNEREQELTRVAHAFLALGVPVFSPITHSAPIERLGLPNDHDFWMAADAPFVDMCSHLVVVKMYGYLDSRGLDHEIERFEAAGKPIIWLSSKLTPHEIARGCESVVRRLDLASAAATDDGEHTARKPHG